MAKKKRCPLSANKKQDVDNSFSFRTDNQVSSPLPLSLSVDGLSDEPPIHEEPKSVLFKNKNYEAKKSTKRKIWKGLKQILSQERSLTWVPEAVFYSNVDAPPSFRPAKKYSDLSGLTGSYTDPHTQLRFALAEEYQTIQTLPSDIVSGYLALRKASNPVG